LAEVAFHLPPGQWPGGTGEPPVPPSSYEASGAGASSAPDIVFFEGVCPGRIALQPAGGGGFGYDPLFIPDGCVQSFAELGEGVKNTLSHRARALEKLRNYFAGQFYS